MVPEKKELVEEREEPATIRNLQVDLFGKDMYINNTGEAYEAVQMKDQKTGIDSESSFGQYQDNFNFSHTNNENKRNKSHFKSTRVSQVDPMNIQECALFEVKPQKRVFTHPIEQE